MKKMFENKAKGRIVPLAVGLLLFVVLSAGVVAANPLVMGVVKNADTGAFIEGADVYATCSGTRVGPITTDVDGFYMLDLSSCTGCEVGSRVDVEATYSGNTGSDWGTVADTYAVLTVNVAVVCVDIPIPEFATIAMPVAAILGLVLFFNHRKHKKE
jgi:hypothetical protein